ncbi:unnamed protein product [Vitrella brassicaformis CCMP3155]|uniref:mannan endo-1,4-beta-mannosidase n=1 Tax=Vitrella brassicaformis (strain CCMP3155) TaxID=1169540 RepID=A0A0G4FNG5_VITBC|nr:unnamed protein product [Vitrella brassicaformis CCMP3155]|eukprot:CEM15566.1 unnamed protein product [Vitrella brassicaformis CCMP3155]
MADVDTAATSPASESQADVFIQRRDGRLWLGKDPFRFAGCNIYWLGLDENVGGVDFPSEFRVRDALETAKEMQLRVVRAHTLGISYGTEDKSFCEGPGKFVHDNLRMADYAITVAKELGLRLIVPLMDKWDYYHGGMKHFTRWRGKERREDFYTDPQVIEDFKTYISELVSHVNPHTGLAWKDEPCIMCWETGNELDSPPEWTRQIADHIKKEAPRQLVMDGRWGVDPACLAIDSVDIVSNHYYFVPAVELGRDVYGGAWSAQQQGKCFVVGEYDWKGYPYGTLVPFLNMVESSQCVTGDLFWSLFPHHDDGGFVAHHDGFTLHYPGDDARMRDRARLIRQHACRMRGDPAPAAHRIPSAPHITQIQHSHIRWRGATGAATYSIEVSLSDDTSSGHHKWHPLVQQHITADPKESDGQSSATLASPFSSLPLLATDFSPPKSRFSLPLYFASHAAPLPPAAPSACESPFPMSCGDNLFVRAMNRAIEGSEALVSEWVAWRAGEAEGGWKTHRGLWGVLLDTLLKEGRVGQKQTRLYFRVRGMNLDGLPGPYSDVVAFDVSKANGERGA